MSGNQWGSLADALKLGIAKEALVEAVLRGDVGLRRVMADRTREGLPPGCMGGDVDWARSEIGPPADYPAYRTWYMLGPVPAGVDPNSARRHFTVQVNLQDARKCLGAKTGGRPPEIPQIVVIEAGAWLYAKGLPERQARLEDAIHELLARRGEKAGESTVRALAQKMLNVYRRGLGEVEN